MGRLFEKIFNHSTKTANSGFLPLPSNLSYAELNHMAKRGFLAKKIFDYHRESDEGTYLFYTSFSKPHFKKELIEETNHDPFLYLSEQMLIWNEEDIEIPKKIREDTSLDTDIQNAMLKTYENYKQDFFKNTSSRQEGNTFSEEEEIPSVWAIYRDVIYAATQGQFLLISKNEISAYRQGKVFCEGTIKKKADIPFCRNNAKECLEEKGYNKSQTMSWLLVLSEAITNTIKHAEEGKMTLIEDEEKNEVRFLIEDRGPGFPLKELPNSTLLAGYSSKKSMGQGFTLMMKMAKEVKLFTSSKGATLILTFDSSKAKSQNHEEAG